MATTSKSNSSSVSSAEFNRVHHQHHGDPLITKSILLVGNPNSGKTTLFNRLTGMRQRVGNFPGVTVEKKTGAMELKTMDVEVTDLPGCYSLAPHSEDEQVVLNSLLVPHDQGGPDLVIGVVDATNVSRHLMLILQVLDLGIPMVIAINRWDMAEKNGITINTELLSSRLGVPVIPVSATLGFGLEALKQVVENEVIQSSPVPALDWPAHIVDLSAECSVKHAGRIHLTPASWRRLIFTRQHPRYHEELIRQYDLQLSIDTARALVQKHGHHPLAAETLLLRRLVLQLVKDAVILPENPPRTMSRIIDQYLTHKIFGLIFFAFVMLLMFVLLFRASEPLVEGLETMIGYASNLANSADYLPAWAISLLDQGLIAGVGGVLTFLPQIILLFLLIGLLEDSGYMARAACVMDRWLSRCGLNGKSMVPMLSSFACAIPGIMATRTIEQPKTRLTTILVAPLISCSARLPVYTLVIGAVIAPRFGSLIAGFVLFLMHLLGLAMAFPAAWILNRKLFKAGHQPLILEMPDYSWPRPLDLFHRIYNSALSFIKRAGTLIVVISLIIWALIYFPLPKPERVDGEYVIQDNVMNSARMETSYLGRMGKAVQPLFALAGYDWKISVGILASFPAREVIVATLSVLYQDGVTDDEKSMQEAVRNAVWMSGPKVGQKVFTLPVAASLLVFIALCMQCAATLIMMAKESQWKYALLAYSIYTLIAWMGAVITYQALNAFGM